MPPSPVTLRCAMRRTRPPAPEGGTRADGIMGPNRVQFVDKSEIRTKISQVLFYMQVFYDIEYFPLMMLVL
ncbi:hypothetical protein MSG28_002548 [Choristoneura fumiferana]|uniref:Uncharacterized protein n=1 Tax=Choristoneura fumiferana TaxID=7141 RepID=A0ACC0JWR5_CHOFU|nr:hypothetical protein MSG28_002548 [Choristoneura fumiferana]